MLVAKFSIAMIICSFYAAPYTTPGGVMSDTVLFFWVEIVGPGSINSLSSIDWKNCNVW